MTIGRAHNDEILTSEHNSFLTWTGLELHF